MVIYLYNESQENLMITSLDGRTVMVTKDNSCFDDILEMCKDPNADFDMISILLNEDFWDYTSSNGKVSIMKEPDDIYYLFGSEKKPLPTYLKTLISERRDNPKLDSYKESICFFLQHRESGDTTVIDACLNTKEFIISKEGEVLLKLDEIGVCSVWPESIKSKIEKDDDKKEVFYSDFFEKINSLQALLNVKRLLFTSVNFLDDFLEKNLELKTEDTSKLFFNFWKEKGIETERISKVGKNKNFQFEFGNYVAGEFCIFDADKIEQIGKCADSSEKFARYWFE